jgi:hypothetical protein
MEMLVRSALLHGIIASTSRYSAPSASLRQVRVDLDAKISRNPVPMAARHQILRKRRKRQKKKKTEKDRSSGIPA